jgi:hypothetical protein
VRGSAASAGKFSVSQPPSCYVAHDLLKPLRVIHLLTAVLGASTDVGFVYLDVILRRASDPDFCAEFEEK